MRFGVRFWPPAVPLDPKVNWLLLRAFGPTSAPAPAVHDPTGLADLAEQLGLLPRVVSRCDPNLLRDQLPSIDEQVVRCQDRLAADRLMVERQLHLADTAAQAMGAPYALLGSAALSKAQPGGINARRVGAVEILITESDVPRFQESIRRAGHEFVTHRPDRSCTVLSFEGMSDILCMHSQLPHVRMVPGGQVVNMQQLLDSSRSSLVTGLSNFAHLPGSDLLLAHTMARGVAQYGFLPRRFPALAMLIDAIDLEIVSDPTRATQALWWVQPDVTYHEVTALREVAKLLLDGEVAKAWTDDGRNGRMLRHLVLGVLDDSYAAGLLAYEAIYRAVELKQDGISKETWPNSSYQLSHWVASAAAISDAGFPSQPPPVNLRSLTATLLRLPPSSTGMAARQLRALTQLILGTRLL